MHFFICRYYTFEQLTFVYYFRKSDHFCKTKERNELIFSQSVANPLTDIENEKNLKSRLNFVEDKKRINICYSPAGRSVLGKTVPEVSSTARGRRPRAVLETEGTVFPNTDRPRPVNNIFIYF